jgi:hypothetical protein
VVAGGIDDSFLQDWHFVKWDLDSEVAAGDHDAIGHCDNGIQMLKSPGALELGDYRHIATTELLEYRSQLLEILGQPDITGCQVVGPNLHRKAEIGMVLGRNLERQLTVREVHSSAAGDCSTGDDTGGYSRSFSLANTKLDETIVNQYALPRLKMSEEAGGLYREVDTIRFLTDSHRFTALEKASTGEAAQPIARAHEVEDDSGVSSSGYRDSANQIDQPSVFIMVPVGEVESHHLGPGADEREERSLVGRGGPERRDDLGPAVHRRGV